MNRLLLALAVSVSAAVAGGADWAGWDELKVKREAVFEFAQKPAVTRNGDAVTIAFESKGFCDATVAIEDVNGRIIRHLASGVLGPNAPEPFQKNAKKQTVVWDGKNEKGEYVDDKDSVTVRVSLGLKPQFEKNLLWEPKRRVGYQPILVAAPEGVYIYESGCGFDSILLFSHDGDYVRTVYPPGAEKIEKMEGLEYREYPPDGQKLPVKHGWHQGTLLTSGLNAWLSSDDWLHGDPAARAMAVSGNRIGLSYEYLNRLATDGTTPGLPLRGPKTGYPGRWGYGPFASDTVFGASSAAFSPSGKRLYVTGYIRQSGGSGQALQGVLEVPFEGGETKTFAGVMDDKKFGTEPGQFRVPTDVACDRQGRVYVADYMNDRVQVFSPEGKFLKAIPVKKPAQIRIHHRTQELWVFSHNEAGASNDIFRSAGMEKLNVKPVLTRFGPFEQPARLSEQDLPLGAAGQMTLSVGHLYQIALDSWAEPAAIWVVGRKGEFKGAVDEYSGGSKGIPDDWERYGIQILVEKEGRWVSRRDFAQETMKSVKRLQPREVAQRLQVNPTNGKLYVLEHTWLKSKEFLIEIEPETGKVKLVNTPFDPEDFCFDLDGHIYLRTDTEVVRYKPDTWREVPWDYGEERESVTFCKTAAKNLTAVLANPGQRPVCWHQGGLWVSPKGHIAVSCVNDSAPLPAAGNIPALKAPVAPAGKPYTPNLFPGRARWQEVHVWDKHGKLVYEDAVPGLYMLNGTAIDNADNLYVMAVANRIIGNKPYPGVMADTLMKFRPAKGRVICATATEIPLPEDLRPKRSPDMARGWYGGSKTWVEGAEWLFGGVGYDGFNGGTFTGRICGCLNSRFTLDYFSRSFAPDIYRYNVAVLDANGNLITRIGRYGNADDGVPLDPKGGPPGTRSLGGDEVGLFHPLFVAAHSDRRLFISDFGNFRILSVKLGYHAEEKVALKNVPDQATNR